MTIMSLAYGVIALLGAAALVFLPGGQFSAGVLTIVSALAVVVAFVARGLHLTVAAVMITVTFWTALMAEPLLTGNLSTNGLFMGLLAALMAVSFRQRWLWLASAVSLGSVGVLAFVTNEIDTPPVGWSVSLVNGTLLVLTAVVGLGVVLWQSRRQLLAEAVAARTVAGSIDQLRRVNAELEAQVVERTRHLERALAERQEAAEALREWTNTDTLTGLRTRGALTDEVRRLSTDLGPDGVGVIVVDMDRFKDINDSYSHHVGDEVLKRLAQIMREEAPAPATIARFGGEEFVILCPGADRSRTLTLAAAVRRRVAQEDWNLLASGLRTTASFGVAVARPSKVSGAQPLQDAVLRAFQGMGGAKARGGDRVADR
jgi:diguanylate cyclase (GGDEF)-like protein